MGSGCGRAEEKRKGRPPTPGTTFLQTEKTSGSMTAAPIPPHWVSSASRFAAGPMRKPEAAHLMDWFYEIPPYRWLLPFGGSRTRYEIIGSATTICALARMDVKTAFLGPNATTAWCYAPFERTIWRGFGAGGHCAC